MNKLSTSNNPYLLQHADNPVEWQLWSDDLFAKARYDDKPIFLSIGYSTCHWCHVMAHESFENEEIAALINDSFIPVKVDREERPDIDHLYMSAVVAMTGQGGWPLNVFLTPEGYPFYGGTYFPPFQKWGQPGFKDILVSIHNAWIDMPRRLQMMESAQKLKTHIVDSQILGNSDVSLSDASLKAAYQQSVFEYDKEYGGFASAPKFPMPHQLGFLLSYHLRTKESISLAMVEETLDAISKGGISDHLNGGIHRYSTDRLWRVPHFEKMLYDQALLSSAYIDAFQVTGKTQYRLAAEKILVYTVEQLGQIHGGFSSAEDADSKVDTLPESPKKEGAFYLWSKHELEILLKDMSKMFCYHYGIESDGNTIEDPHAEFDGKNVFFQAHSVEETAIHCQLTVDEVTRQLETAHKILKQQQKQRPRPHLDDKVMLDWNALIIASLVKAARVFDSKTYLMVAEKNLCFIEDTMITASGLKHCFRKGVATVPAYVDDYAFLIKAYIETFQTTFEAVWLEKALALQQKQDQLFWDDEIAGYLFTAKNQTKGLFMRKAEWYDGAVPSGNSVSAENLYRLFYLTGDSKWEKRADRLLQAAMPMIEKSPVNYCQWLMALDWKLGPTYQVVIALKDGVKSSQFLSKLQSCCSSRQVIIVHDQKNQHLETLYALIPYVKNHLPIDNKETVYICQNQVCLKPLTQWQEIENVIDGF